MKAGSGQIHGAIPQVYLSAFTTGDLRVSLHGRRVRVEASSAHPAQLELVGRFFDPYRKRIAYPIETPRGWAWRFVYDLGPAFSFLLDARSRTYAALRSKRQFYVAMAGLIDSEGHVGLLKSGSRIRPVIAVSNSDTKLIKLIAGSLLARGYHVSVQRFRPLDSVPQSEVFLYGKSAIRLSNKLILRHREKIEARDIVVHSLETPQKAHSKYLQLRRRIKHERNLCVQDARRAYLQRGLRRRERVDAYVEFAETALDLRLAGKSIQEIGISLERSERTVYRLLRRADDARKPERETEQAHRPKKSLLAKTCIQSR